MKRLLCFLLLAMPAALFAQNAQINGLVRDPKGAVIPDVTMTLTNTLTGGTSSNKSTKWGSYIFAEVAPGQYSLRAEHEGFSVTEIPGIILHVGDNKALDVSLKVGSTAQTVTVDGSALTINTTDGTVGTVIDRKFVENMPVVLAIHVESIEPLAAGNDAQFVPPPDARRPEVRMVAAAPSQTGSDPISPPIQVSSGVAEGLLASRIPPIYPPVAAAAHVQGTVVLKGLVGKDGRVESLEVLSGPSLLRQTALDTVKTWTTSSTALLLSSLLLSTLFSHW